MTEPTTANVGFIVPNTGDLSGAWGTSALNVNWQAVDGMIGGVVSISLSAATTIALATSGAPITAGSGPNQSSNAMIRFSGAMSGTATIQFSIPKMYIIDNQATGTFPIVLAPSAGTGTQIGAPPGRKTTVFYDGTNVDYLNPPDPGTAIDLHGVTAVPAWMRACTKQYALIKDGTSFSTSAFSALFNVIGTTFGGSGGSFNVPDESARMRVAIDHGGTGRITAGGSGINATVMGAAGGNELMQSHNHAATSNVTDPGHRHSYNNPIGGSGGVQGGGLGLNGDQTGTSTTGISVSTVIGNTGGGGSQNMPPTIVSFLALIKT